MDYVMYAMLGVLILLLGGLAYVALCVNRNGSLHDQEFEADTNAFLLQSLPETLDGEA